MSSLPSLLIIISMVLAPLYLPGRCCCTEPGDSAEALVVEGDTASQVRCPKCVARQQFAGGPEQLSFVGSDLQRSQSQSAAASLAAEARITSVLGQGHRCGCQAANQPSAVTEPSDSRLPRQDDLALCEFAVTPAVATNDHIFSNIGDLCRRPPPVSLQILHCCWLA